jgi:hypothetical protein
MKFYSEFHALFAFFVIDPAFGSVHHDNYFISGAISHRYDMTM